MLQRTTPLRRTPIRRKGKGQRATAEHKRRFARLVLLGCAVCRQQGVYSAPEIHHLRGHPWSGAGMRADHAHTIGLCAQHHRHGGGGEVGYHQSPAEFEARYGTQAELFAITDKLMEGGA